MKICLHRKLAAKHRRSDRGWAVLIVLILLAAIASLTIGNGIALAHLRKELRLIEQRQLHKSGAIEVTNRKF